MLLRKRLSNMERTIKVDNERLERRMKELEEEHAELGERVKDLEDTIVMMKTAREFYAISHVLELRSAFISVREKCMLRHEYHT